MVRIDGGLAVAVLLVSCSPGPRPTKAPEPVPPAGRSLFFADLEFTAEETAGGDRLMTMVPLYPRQNLLTGCRGEESRSPGQINGFAKSEDFDFRKDTVGPDTDVLAEVLGNRADDTLVGGLVFAQNRTTTQGLSLFPFPLVPARVGGL